MQSRTVLNVVWHRRARTGTCFYHTEDIYRSALNFNESPSSTVINNPFHCLQIPSQTTDPNITIYTKAKHFKLPVN